MKKVCEGLGMIMLIQGAAGLLHDWTGWFHYWAVIRRLSFLDGHELYANLALVLLGLVALSAPTALAEHAERRAAG
ncbi:hypothetical protein [Streptomyces sp. SAJ15]|uniref:hypothetical protein n=1 Tax=Streptomyces sp. SAJ15 TaxID=2011095 RepID=UPI0011862434|nr:hypothetical protein [Streptomyces sp. SAJ15]TVL92849.1 hypothetical protein CD790_06755 [Streptomyces sp. SAJ15]